MDITIITSATYTIPTPTYVETIIDDTYLMITHSAFHLGLGNISAGVFFEFELCVFIFIFFSLKRP